MSARASRVPWALVLAVSAGLAAMPSPSSALSVQEALLLALPAVALVSAEVRASATVNCGQGPVTVNPRPFVESGTGWFVDGRGYLVTNAHVVDPAYRRPPWVAEELTKKAIDLACVAPELRRRGLIVGQRPDVEDRIRRGTSDRAFATAKVTSTPKIVVRLS